MKMAFFDLLLSADWDEDLTSGTLIATARELADRWNLKDSHRALGILLHFREIGIIKRVDKVGWRGMLITVYPKKKIKGKEGGKEDENEEEILYTVRLH